MLSRNASNTNCPHRFKRFPAEIIGINNDATYRVRYNVRPNLMSLLRAHDPSSSHKPYAENVREMWIQHPVDSVKEAETTFLMTYNAKLVATWDYAKVLQWLCDVGINEKTQNLFKNKKIEGRMLLQLETKGEKECREGLAAMLLGQNAQNGDKGSNIDDALELSQIEMKNMFVNIKHLMSEHEKVEQNLGAQDDEKEI